MAAENEFMLYALLMGIFITFIYDILRIFRRVIPHNGFFVSLEDLFFWIYCAMEVFLLMYHESNGTLRWFAVLGAVAGMFAYKKLISPFFVKYVSLFLNKLILPVVRFGKWLIKPLKAGLARVKKTTEKVKLRSVHRKSRIRWLLKKKLTFLMKMLKMTI